MEGDPQLLSQQMPTGCSLVHVGVFTWDSDWVKSTLLALCKAFKTPVDTHAPAQQVQYVDILVDKDRPVRNPSLEKTNYSEISSGGVKAADLVEEDTNPMEEQFQTDVIEALTEIGMALHLRELDFFTATYQTKGFLGVSRVESGVDVTPADVEKVVRAKTKMAASRAVLICNQDTIPLDRLVDLQKASCYFIQAGGYGTEKWKNHLISNFKETVDDWMKEQNRGLHRSEKEEGRVGPPEKEAEVVGPPEKEEGEGHPEKKEVVSPSEKEEGERYPKKKEAVDHPEKKEAQKFTPIFTRTPKRNNVREDCDPRPFTTESEIENKSEDVDSGLRPSQDASGTELETSESTVEIRTLDSSYRW